MTVKSNVRTAIVSSVLATVLIIAIAALTANPVADIALKRSSTFFTDDTGARGIYLVMEKVFPFAEQWRRPLTDLAMVTPDATLIVMHPAATLNERDAEALDQWIQSGGQLVLATNAEWKIRVSNQQFLPKGYLERHELTPKTSLSGLPIEAAEMKSIARGRLVYVSDDYAFSNGTLRRTDNSVWLAERISEWGSAEALFDEYHQGFGVKRTFSAVLGAFFFSPWGLVFIQLGLAGAIYMVGCKRRLGRPIEELQIDRTSPLEAIRALAGLFESARARALSARAMHQYLNVYLSALLGFRVDVLKEDARERLARRSSVGKADLDAYAANVKSAIESPAISDARLTEIGRLATIISRSFSHGVASRKRSAIAG